METSITQVERDTAARVVAKVTGVLRSAAHSTAAHSTPTQAALALFACGGVQARAFSF